MKDKQGSEVIYALADYKQLVLAYRTKHAELIKALTFWKTSLIWLGCFSAFLVLAAMFWLQGTVRELDSSRKTAEMLKAQASFVAESLAGTEKELLVTKEELKNKEETIRSLEKNISTASKNLLEKLLVDKDETATK